MDKMVLRIVSGVISALLCLLSLVSCEGKPGGEESDISPVFESLDTLEEPKLDFEPVEVIATFEKSSSARYSVSSENYGVTPEVFEVLFDIVLYHQLEEGDGEYDEYDEYFSTGALDRDGSIEAQRLPDSDLYWYADARNKALIICFESLGYLEFARSVDAFPLSRRNKVFLDRESRKILNGTIGDPTEDYFGEHADETTVRAALALKLMSDSPETLTTREEYESFRRPDYDVDESLLPKIPPAYLH